MSAASIRALPIGPSVLAIVGAVVVAVGVYFPGVSVSGKEYTLIRTMMPFSALGFAMVPAAIAALVAALLRRYRVALVVGLTAWGCAGLALSHVPGFVDDAHASVAAGGAVVPSIGQGEIVVSVGAAMLVAAAVWGRARVH